MSQADQCNGNLTGYGSIDPHCTQSPGIACDGCNKSQLVCGSQIDEFIKTGTLAALSEAEGAVEGGDAPEKQEAVKGKATNMAMKFL